MKIFSFPILLIALCSLNTGSAQYANVTITLDNPSISVGGATTLRVFAQVIPAQRANTDRIFSWYVDFINETPGVAQALYSNLLKNSSDKDPWTSSFGAPEGANRRGIYDTFRIDTPTSKSGSGVNTPVELFSVPIQATAPGQARFRVSAGTGVSGLFADFIIAPKGGGDPLIGGIYEAATSMLETIEDTACAPPLRAAYSPLGGGQNKITLTFTPCPGKTQFIEFADRIFPPSWQTLPNGPHNSGTAADTNSVKLRFYRLRIQ